MKSSTPTPAEIARVERMVAKVNRRLAALDPAERVTEVMRIRLQILHNSVRLVGGLEAPARAAILEQVDDLAAIVKGR